MDKLEGIVRESVRPLEYIDSIKILRVDGLTGRVGNDAMQQGGVGFPIAS